MQDPTRRVRRVHAQLLTDQLYGAYPKRHWTLIRYVTYLGILFRP